MKDKHCIILWIISTMLFSFWMTEMIVGKNDYVECLFTCVLLSQLGFVFYCLLVLLLNGALREYCSHRIKLPIKLRFKTKKSPIYELQFSHLNGTYGISKWELKWCDSDNWLIPFSALFHTYKYVEVGNYGRFLEEDLFYLENLNTRYERLSKDDSELVNLESSEKDKIKQEIEKLNKEFTENYER